MLLFDGVHSGKSQLPTTKKNVKRKVDTNALWAGVSEPAEEE
jgi:hypothetical protein